VTIWLNGSMNFRNSSPPSMRPAGASQTMSSAMYFIAWSKSWAVHAS
jgi:hypothetical protein